MTPMDKACPKLSVPGHIHIPVCTHDPWLLLASVALVSKVITGILAVGAAQVYMVEANVRLNFDHMLEIYKSGYTRIPVYDTQPQAIIGILYTKDLILVDPGVRPLKFCSSGCWLS